MPKVPAVVAWMDGPEFKPLKPGEPQVMVGDGATELTFVLDPTDGSGVSRGEQEVWLKDAFLRTQALQREAQARGLVFA